MNAIGFDVGTYNLIAARPKGDKETAIKREINVFIHVEQPQKFTKTMLKQQGVPLIEKDDSIYVLGQAAVDLAVDLGVPYRRPMYKGCLSAKEKDAFELLAAMLKGMVGPIKAPTVLYFSVPAAPIDAEGDSKYHEKVVQSIFSSVPNLEAIPINEALAIVYAGSPSKTGIGISFGAGMVNICFSKLTIPIFQFALTESGDWIDRESSRVCGESEAFINQQKLQVDLSQPPKNAVEMAITRNYEILIEKSISKIADGIEASQGQAKTDAPVPIIAGGGTSMVKGFLGMFKKVLAKNPLPIEIKEVIRPQNPLHAVAEGCLLASQAHILASEDDK